MMITKHLQLVILFFYCSTIKSQIHNFSPLSSENINFTIENFQLDNTDPKPNYLVINDSIILTFNNDEKKIYFSSDYGINFKNIKFSTIFKTDEKQIVGLFRRNDEVLITFNDGKQNIFKFYNNNFYSNEINFEPKPQNCNANYFNFKNKILIQLFNKIYIENEKKWIEYNIPSDNTIIKLYEYGEYIYAFNADNKSGIAENNSILKSKDFISWEKVEIGLNFKEVLFHNKFKINALTNNIICYSDDKKLNNFYDLNKQIFIEINGLSNLSEGSRTNLNMYIPYQNKGDKVYVFNNQKLSSINFDTLSLIDEFKVRGSNKFKFYFSNKIGIFNVNEIYMFDKTLLEQKNKNLKTEIPINISKYPNENALTDNMKKSNSIDLNMIPVDKLNKEQCFEIMDKMVKNCNGKNMTSKNYTQFQGSFTSEGYAILTDYKMRDEKDLTLIVCRNIQWETIYSISSNELNFLYSCVCLKFPSGYSCYRQIARTTDRNFSDKIRKNENPITLNENEFPYKMIQNPYVNGDNFIVNLKKQDVKKFIELVKRISIIEREKNINLKQNLIPKEKWNDSILIKWHEDSDGNRQGRYEEYDIKGNLVTYGNYRNNVREKKWVINGVVKDFPTFLNESCFCD